MSHDQMGRVHKTHSVDRGLYGIDLDQQAGEFKAAQMFV